jgi:hypothetical protein
VARYNSYILSLYTVPPFDSAIVGPSLNVKLNTFADAVSKILNFYHDKTSQFVNRRIFGFNILKSVQMFIWGLA